MHGDSATSSFFDLSAPTGRNAATGRPHRNRRLIGSELFGQTVGGIANVNCAFKGIHAAIEHDSCFFCNTFRDGTQTHIVFESPMDLKDMIRIARNKAGLTQEQLGHAIGMSGQSTIGNYERGPNTPTWDVVRAIAEACGLTFDQFVRIGTAGDPLTNAANAANISAPKSEFPEVPVISFVQAGKLSEIGHVPDLHESEHLPTVRPTKKVGARSWAHEVEGYSMDDGTPNGIKPGWRIICDPDREYRSGSLVIAKDVRDQSATFKQLVHDDGRWFLRPLNRDPIYKTVEIDDPSIRIIAVVTEAIPPSIVY